MEGFKKYFDVYGADYQATMDRFMNNKAMYLRLLDMLFQDDTMRQLGAALEAGNLREAFDAAHTLKGVVGNMGLTPLSRAISAIVEPLRIGEQRTDYPALYQAIQVEFQKADEFRTKLKGEASV